MTANSEQEFFIGWQAPLTRRVRRHFVIGLLLALTFIGATAALLAGAQRTFDPSYLEFGVQRKFSGVVSMDPYPQLVVDRAIPGGPTVHTRYLLSAPFKHGADSLVRPYSGQRVTLSGSLLYNRGAAMIEVAADSVRPASGESSEHSPPTVLGEFTFVGEIVDSKCYLGAMNPGRHLVHRACAERCISGGIPPMLLVHAADGREYLMLLSDENGGQVNRAVLGLIARPVRIRGRLEAYESILVLRANPAMYQRLD
ncbi:MAG: hypothetical protein K1X75_01660 [Leptospirales bacterium]|nr:hypothetical protein [Leptospirales bacterium]